MAAKLCPLKTPCSDACPEEPRCYEERCACWDDGVYDKYSAGCGMVPRESRRV